MATYQTATVDRATLLTNSALAISSGNTTSILQAPAGPNAVCRISGYFTVSGFGGSRWSAGLVSSIQLPALNNSSYYVRRTFGGTPDLGIYINGGSQLIGSNSPTSSDFFSDKNVGVSFVGGIFNNLVVPPNFYFVFSSEGTTFTFNYSITRVLSTVG